MSGLLYNYVLVGTAFGAGMFFGNMASVCIPGNNRVDPKYEWSALNWDKVGDCIVISATKAIICGTQWPYFLYTFITNPRSICNHYNLGYIFSSHAAELRRSTAGN